MKTLSVAILIGAAAGKRAHGHFKRLLKEEDKPEPGTLGGACNTSSDCCSEFENDDDGKDKVVDTDKDGNELKICIAQECGCLQTEAVTDEKGEVTEPEERLRCGIRTSEDLVLQQRYWKDGETCWPADQCGMEEEGVMLECSSV